MTRSDGDRDPADDGLDAVAQLVREASPDMTPLQRMRGLRAVTLRRELHRRRRTLAVASALSACGLAAAAVVALVATRGDRSVEVSDPNPLSYRVDHGEIGDGGYLRSYGGAGVALHFAEGTELRLAAGARGRLTSVDGQGARFAIEQGEAEVNVAPRPKARWLIDAGPFLITVHGTVFTAAWDGTTERLDIKMKHGLVSVTGPVADGRIAVRAGQRLTINVQKREVLLRPSDDAEAIPAHAVVEPTLSKTLPKAPAEAPPVVGDVNPGRVPRLSRDGVRRAEPGPTAVGARAAVVPSRGWASALAAGDFQGILSEADHHGLRRSLAEARSEDLAALADAARYLRHDEIARQALIAQRDRFPRSDRAHEAAFLLGRLTETGAGGDLRALSWYDRYLGEAPTGAYASEALGRKMTATEKLRGLAAAREIARDYLRRFPHGTYAGAARALSEGHQIR